MSARALVFGGDLPWPVMSERTQLIEPIKRDFFKQSTYTERHEVVNSLSGPEWNRIRRSYLS
eukprot:27939-Eustigmatos_ZCMA.PRE.1